MSIFTYLNLLELCQHHGLGDYAPEIKPVSRPSYYPHMSAETHDMNSLHRQEHNMTLRVKRSNVLCLHAYMYVVCTMLG